MILTLDIETIPTSDPEIIAEITAGILPPKTMSKAETIAEWEKEDKPGLVAEAIKRTSFDAAFGSICCIGVAVDQEKPEAFCSAFESWVLDSAFDWITEHVKIKYRGGSTSEAVVVVGHNLLDFDLRFLWQRAVINRTSMPSCLPRNPKPWDKTVADTMRMWNPDSGKRISLDRLCRALGIKTSKGDMDGSMVADAAARGEYDRIAAYCCEDVVATRECYLRMASV